MRKIAIFLFAIAVGGMVCGQEQVLSLRQIVDSVLSNRAKFIPLQFRQSEEMNGNLWRPLEISYRKGYLYSTQVEQEWRIQQELENPIRWFDRGKLKKNEVLSITADSALQVKQLIAAVKKAYFLCVYRYALYNHYRRVLEMVERMMSGLPVDSMEGRLNSLYSEWWVKQQDSYFDWLDAQNELRYQAGLKVWPLPADTVPVLYQIEPIPDTLTRTPARLFYHAYLARLKYEESYDQWVQHGRWPSLFLDVSLRNNTSRQNLMAWQLGVRIPLTSWMSSHQSSRVNTHKNIASYEWQKQKEALDYQSEKLIIQMNKRFSQVNYYRNRILPLMERETYRIVNEMFDNQSSTVFEGVSNFLSWQLRYVDYLSAIYEYNCLAADLEILAY
ncbi:MAG: hypothetical protein WHT29_12385 [Bacteroidales bacterium]